MPKPNVDVLAQDPNLYQWYVDLERNPTAVNIGTTVMSWMQPRIVWGPGVRQEMINHRAEGGMFAINGSHQSFTDQFQVGGLPRKDPEVFGDLEGSARITAKVPLFKIPILRTGVEIMGSIPATRYKDVKKSLGRDLTDEECDILAASQDEMIDAVVQTIVNGQDYYNFPKGTRDASKKVKGGMGKVAVRVPEEVNLAISPMGIYYPDFKGHKVLRRRNVFRPTIYMDHLIHGPFTDEDEVTQQLTKRLDYSVAMAKGHTPRLLYRDNNRAELKAARKAKEEMLELAA